MIVVRGNEPMAPRDMIRMQMPAQAQAQLAGRGRSRPTTRPHESATTRLTGLVNRRTLES